MSKTPDEATTRIFFGSLATFILSKAVLHNQHTMSLENERLVNSLILLILTRTLCGCV